MLIGVISDTHGLLRPEAANVLRESDLIIHAGDVGGPAILEQLGGLASVRAVRGNVDVQAWADDLPETDVVEVDGQTLYVLHNLKDLDLNPRAARFSVVISGHTHKPLIETRDQVLYFNPGSAGPRRFNLPITVGRLYIRNGVVSPEIIDLHVPK